LSSYLFKLSWKEYLDFSEQIETLLYCIRSPKFYRDDDYFHISEEYFTGNPLGVESGDMRPIKYYGEKHRIDEGASLGVLGEYETSNYEKFNRIKGHAVYEEFTGGRKEKRDVDDINGFKIRLTKRLKGFGINEDHELYGVFMLRYYGLVSYYLSRYLRRKEKISLGVYNKKDHKKLKASINLVVRYLSLGLSVPDSSKREDIISTLNQIEEMNSLSANEELLHPDSYKYKNPEMVATIREFLLFCTYCGEKRSPSLTKSIFYMFEPGLTERIVEKACKDVKRYILSRKINRTKILLREQYDQHEGLIAGEKFDDKFSVPTMYTGFFEEERVTADHEAVYEKEV